MLIKQKATSHTAGTHTLVAIVSAVTAWAGMSRGVQHGACLWPINYYQWSLKYSVKGGPLKCGQTFFEGQHQLFVVAL